MPRPRLCRSRLRERLFHLALYLKVLDAILEIVGGIALLLVSPAWIVRLVAVATQDELIEDPRDLVANFLRRQVLHPAAQKIGDKIARILNQLVLGSDRNQAHDPGGTDQEQRDAADNLQDRVKAFQVKGEVKQPLAQAGAAEAGARHIMLTRA